MQLTENGDRHDQGKINKQKLSPEKDINPRDFPVLWNQGKNGRGRDTTVLQRTWKSPRLEPDVYRKLTVEN